MSGPDSAEPDTRDVEYAIENDWLVEVVNEHTCGTGPGGYYGAHEPGCGMVPIANISELLDAVRRKAGDERAEQIAQAMLEEIADRVTWGDGTEYIAVTEARRIARDSR